jgi:voltage-gated potassium channel
VRIGHGSPLDGRTLVEAGLRQRFGVVVVGIRRTDGRMDFNPAPETAMHAGDDLVVLGRSGSLSDLELTATAAGQGRA